MFSSASSAARTLFIPLCLLLAAHYATPLLQNVPQAQRPFLTLLPYAAAALPLSIALLLRQGRMACLSIWLVLGYWGLILTRLSAESDPWLSAVLFHSCSILLPLNLVICSHISERPLISWRGMLLLGLIPVQLGLIIWIIWSGQTALLESVGRAQLPLQLNGLRMPPGAITVFIVALILQLWQLWRQQSALSAGLLIVLLALAIACNRADTFAVPEAFTTAAALVLAVALVLHTHHIAYRDELTDLPSRRALNEYLETLGRRYTIAMLDVDHFKKFNDTYGHDIGDQVLKMVASQIRQVGGGGKAFRYGGEEFTIVFAGRDEEHARPYLEELRESIADYTLTLRGEDRPESSKVGRGRRGQGRQQRSTRVTISIGMASRTRQLRDAEAVIKAADQALYRAKQAGRNRLAT